MLKFSISASSESELKTFSSTPSSFHLRNLEYTVCQGPYFSGSSLHCAPLLAIHIIPFNMVRLSFAGRPFPVCGCGNSFLFVSVVRLLFRIYSCFYFIIFWFLVQLLFFKQALVLVLFFGRLRLYIILTRY